ncbi:phosphotriesterase-related protein [Alteribacillus persepolensis]|uniref:Phosphotriesterase-related protein n=1 Tax=Alteribacillus persepolensis TaxID=568899 RepID=A0A1G8KHZ3_9BACI|nr:aryldialkylphosphatase [Alteribacillus persepolensis]SDI43005.1 phosphotriesterase-related protein [Alteribacillus persepolensis]
MGKINTIQGAIATEQLGITAMHEHIGFGLPGCDLDTKWWEARPKMLEVTIDKLRRFRELGGQTIVDCTGIGTGRNIPYWQVVSQTTGVNIVACTGFVAGDTVLPYFRDKSVEYLADLFYHEITVGIAGTNVKAGAVKVGVSRGGLSELDERVYRAAARAARVTGVPIATHLSTNADRQMDLFEMEGLPLNRVLIGHADAGVDPDWKRDLRVAKRDAFVGYDTIGYDTEKGTPELSAPYWSRPREERLRHVVDFLESGYAHRVVISADANCWPLGWASPPHSVAELLEVFVPDLKARGVSDETIEQLLIHTPAHLLTMQDPKPRPEQVPAETRKYVK